MILIYYLDRSILEIYIFELIVLLSDWPVVSLLIVIVIACFDFGSSSPLPPPPALRYTTCTINKYEQQQLSLHTTTKPAIPLLMSSITKTPKRKFLVELYLRL